MKFTDVDLCKQFLVEVGRVDLLPKADIAFEPPKELLELFIKGRETIVPKLKSFRRSQSAKSSWRHNRYNLMKGIRTFHKSTEGKRFHRSLGRYLSTRIIKRGGMLGLSPQEKFESLKSLSSLRTHLYIDTVYYRPLNEQVEFDLFLDEAVIATINEEKSLYNDKVEYSAKDMDILCRAVHPKDLLQGFCEVTENEFKDEKLQSLNEMESAQTLTYPGMLKRIILGVIDDDDSLE